MNESKTQNVSIDSATANLVPNVEQNVDRESSNKKNVGKHVKFDISPHIGEDQNDEDSQKEVESSESSESDETSDSNGI